MYLKSGNTPSDFDDLLLFIKQNYSGIIFQSNWQFSYEEVILKIKKDIVPL
jgi:hypothetical protein